jgi:hypothetical protein
MKSFLLVLLLIITGCANKKPAKIKPVTINGRIPIKCMNPQQVNYTKCTQFDKELFLCQDVVIKADCIEYLKDINK